MASPLKVLCMRDVRLRVVLPFLLSAALYVVAGWFVDLPPYGIHLESASSHVDLDGGVARVSGELRYACTSWRSRRTDVYLPISTDGASPAADVRLSVEPGTTYDVHEDGVVLHLAMAPHSQQAVRFELSQALRGKRYRYVFTVPRGWSVPPNLVSYVVTGPMGTQVAPPARYAKSSGRAFATVDGAPDGLDVTLP